MRMWYGIVLGALGAFFSILVSRQVAQSVREFLVRQRKMREAVAAANMAAAEIQRMLSGRSRSLHNMR